MNFKTSAQFYLNLVRFRIFYNSVAVNLAFMIHSSKSHKEVKVEVAG